MSMAAEPVEPLTSRERQIAGLVAEGLTAREIAARLSVSRRTVDAHLDSIYRKTGTGSRVRLLLWLRQTGTAGTATHNP